MGIKPSILAAMACAAWTLAGCKARETAAPPAGETLPTLSSTETSTLPVEVAATPAEATPTTIPTAPLSPVAARQASPTREARPATRPSPSKPPQPVAAAPEPAREMATPRPAPATSAPVAPTPVAAKATGVVDPGGTIAVASTKPGLTRIGAEKCKTCHKVQFASWAGSAHAKRTPPLDCEHCHGPGSEYKSLAVMKDPEKAKAAGLVMPTATFCARCHTSGWKDDMLRKAHAHKAGT